MSIAWWHRFSAPTGRAVGEITLDQLLHATRRDIHEQEHRERFLYLVRATGKRP
jgi:hypothetical protein